MDCPPIECTPLSPRASGPEVAFDESVGIELKVVIAS